MENTEPVGIITNLNTVITRDEIEFFVRLKSSNKTYLSGIRNWTKCFGSDPLHVGAGILLTELGIKLLQTKQVAPIS